jgi:hypothetical protein
MIRLEIPGHEADESALSIHRTNAATALLEWSIGLLIGLLAVNRGDQLVSLDGFPSLAPGELFFSRRSPGSEGYHRAMDWVRS